eukprot:3159149-Amphidinium_carterae.1
MSARPNLGTYKPRIQTRTSLRAAIDNHMVRVDQEQPKRHISLQRSLLNMLLMNVLGPLDVEMEGNVMEAVGTGADPESFSRCSATYMTEFFTTKCQSDQHSSPPTS